MELEKGKEVIIYPSTTKLVVLFIFSLMFVLIGALFIVIGFEIDIGINTAVEKESSRYGFRIVGIISCLFFGFCGWYVVKRLLIRTPSLIISKYGVTDNASAIAAGFLKWSEIKNFLIYYYGGQKLLGIEPVDVEGTLNKVSKFKRAILNLNKGLGVTIINIPKNSLNMPLEEVHELMVEYKKQQVS
ncbi:MAG TPA: STM3941 family protein [Pseudobacteroides sp.]|nr:STM3941 family protein [Pseudobacteroides sp.]